MKLKFYRQILYFADKNIAIYERSRSNHAQPIVILPKIDKIKLSVLCKITSEKENEKNAPYWAHFVNYSTFKVFI